ncbi:MAG: L,D-transpeptidase [Candidatus Buchananbacteria bacterium]
MKKLFLSLVFLLVYLPVLATSDSGDWSTFGQDSVVSQLAAASTKTIIVLVDSQVYYCLESAVVVRSGKVSTGKKGMPTPVGQYKIGYKVPKKKYIDKQTGESCWLTSFMPFYGSYAIHGIKGTTGQYAAYEKFLGRPASHGCVRVSQLDADWLYGWAEKNTTVSIIQLKNYSFVTSKVTGQN